MQYTDLFGFTICMSLIQTMYRLMDLLSNSTTTHKEIYFDNHEKLLGHESAFVKLLSSSNK